MDSFLQVYSRCLHASYSSLRLSTSSSTTFLVCLSIPSLLQSHQSPTQYGVPAHSVSASSVPPSQPPSPSTSSPLCLSYMVYSSRPLKPGIPSPAACLPVWAFWSSWVLAEWVRTFFLKHVRALIRSSLNRPNSIGMVGLGIGLPRCFSVRFPSSLPSASLLITIRTDSARLCSPPNRSSLCPLQRPSKLRLH